MTTKIATEALIAIESHVAECSMYRLGVNARLKRLERITYTFFCIVIADYFNIFALVKGLAS